MGLYEDAINDAADITSDTDGFAVPVLITDSNGLQITVNALHAKHHLAIDSEGRQVSGKTASVAVAEKNIIAVNPFFLIRDPLTNEVVMKGYKVTATDSAGVVCHYKIQQQFPDETNGLLVFTLSDFK